MFATPRSTKQVTVPELLAAVIVNDTAPPASVVPPLGTDEPLCILIVTVCAKLSALSEIRKDSIQCPAVKVEP